MRRLLKIIGPGLLVAATGVGAGDLATAALTGSALGCGVLWAVLVGAAIKYLQNEGIARWQLATGTTFLRATLEAAPRALVTLFLLYFLVWSFLVAAALMSACGVAGHALLPLLPDPDHDKILYGALHAGLALLLVRRGGFRVFERAMSVSIVVLFVVIVVTCGLLLPRATGVLEGLFVPRIPDVPGALGWTVALMGGIGGTLTILCYGYWIREEGRTGVAELRASRVDLACAYAMTALFGLCMVVIGSTIAVEGRGATLVVRLADRLALELGTPAKWAFLAGAWCAIASSLLGVLQSVPYLFADIVAARRREEAEVAEVRDPARRGRFQVALALVPMLGLLIGFAHMQKAYAITGALFMPLLAAALLVMNGNRARLGAHANGVFTRVALWAILLFFAALLVSEFG